MAIAGEQDPIASVLKHKKSDTMTNIVSFDDFSDSEIRATEDGRYSVFDVIKFCGKSGQREVWKRLTEQYSEVVTKTDNFKFPGKGQRETPVANRENILYIIGLLPGAIGRAYREDAARVFIQYLDASPELAESVIDRATPEDLKRIQARLDGKKIRVSFASTLQDHGITEGWQFGACTDAIYRPLFGKSAKQLRQDRNLPAKATPRDAMTNVELAAVSLAEALADETIITENRQGFKQCRDACQDSGEQVSKVINHK